MSMSCTILNLASLPGYLSISLSYRKLVRASGQGYPHPASFSSLAVQQVTKDGWEWRFRKFMWGTILHNWGNLLILCCNHIALNTHTEQYYRPATVQQWWPGHRQQQSRMTYYSTIYGVVTCMTNSQPKELSCHTYVINTSVWVSQLTHRLLEA